MTYAKLYPSLVLKNLIQPRNPSQISKPLPWWSKPDLHYAFHQGAPGHDIENCYPLKYEVQKLVKSGMVSFEDRAPNVKANPLPAHGNTIINMVDECQGNLQVFDVRRIRRSLVEMHRTLCFISDCEHDHDGCVICSMNPRGCMTVKRDIQKLMDENVIQIQQSRDINDVNVVVPVFKTPERVVIEFDSSSNNNVNRSISPLVIRLAGYVPYSSDKDVSYQYNATMVEDGQEVPLPVTNSVVNIADVAKVTRCSRVFSPVFPKIIEDVTTSKKEEIPVANPLLQTPSKIFVLSLLMNSEAHREALQKVLEQAYVEHDVTVIQFDHIVANITCNNLSFCDKDINHNLALHISMNCKEDALSNVLVDTSFLLGRPWIHEAGAVTSTLHQKLKFVKNEKLIVVGGEKASLVSHLSSFTRVKAKEEVGTPFQALSIADEIKKTGEPMSSLKDAQEGIHSSNTNKWVAWWRLSRTRTKMDWDFNQGRSMPNSKLCNRFYAVEGSFMGMINT
ncbi:hypothetical protein KIW84_010644 [Lathyrus oleraceus]|uniref:Uncharacterized protein n=1 Tax=Pisum sativum TaxID=3888 RepID=A0A9D5BA26_PEA|nr:hypothetical protein KIW84_010644 [Pisum sativum]